jgi:hypothetical protein
LGQRAAATVDRVDTAVARELLEGIAQRDYGRIEACFAADAELRALTPHQLREEHGAAAIAMRYREWLGPLDEFEVIDSGAKAIADRIRIRYHFRGRDPVKGAQENEHTTYAEIAGGVIVKLNLSCAGFRPAEPAA